MKVVSYVFLGLGLLVMALSVPPIFAFAVEKVGFLEGVNSFIFIGVGAVLVVVGVFLGRGSRGRRQKGGIELPIFQGNKVVGYRRE